MIQIPENSLAYKDTSLPLKQRVDDLISRMTLAEKISQMIFDSPAIEHLGIPKHNWWNEGLHGMARAGQATVFPQAIGLAATWNAELLHQIATTISDEGRAKHHHAARNNIREMYTGLTYWSPNVNIFRDPRWGRGQETYGEDPYLSATMGVAFVKGLQGDDPHYLKLAATPKHYAVHSGPETDRHHFDAQVGEQDLRETYLPAFEACVKVGQAVSIMGAYNRVNGEPSCASPILLEQILRQEWGFEGYVVSDCEAIRDIFEHHQVVNTAEEAAALAVKNGCELNCGLVYIALLEAVEQGLITEETIDRAVKRLFMARFRLGIFDPLENLPYTQFPYEVINAPEHRALALQAAREAIVLLKNEGDLLPLSKDLGAVAVIGPNANKLQSLLGNYNGTPVKATTPLEGIRQKILPAGKLYYAQGCAIADGVPPYTAIPTTYLHPENGSAGETGLTGAYYNNSHFNGEPAFTRVDPVIDFIWQDTNPVTGQWGDHFAVRWSGYVTPPVNGTYRLGVNGFSGYRLYLDGELIAEYNDIHHPAQKTKDVELEAGRFYHLQLDYFNQKLDPQVTLLWATPKTDYLTQAVEVAQKADVVVLVMGLSPALEGEEMPVEVDGFIGGDRTDISLPRPQEELLRQIYALGKPTVLVLLNGSAVAINWAAEHIPAIVEAWYPGQAGGEAIAETLFGEYNPAGRLPVTFYKSVGDLPPFEDYAMAGRTYRYFQGEPLFPFGHGLSYTTFKLGNLRLDQTELEAGGQIQLSADITNTGPRDGDEVVQLYVSDHRTTAPRPLKELKGFKRIHLKTGETRTVTFTLYANQLGFYNQAGQYILEPGEVELLVGASSENLPLRAAVQIVGDPVVVGPDKAFFSEIRVS
jgi:beta-glucosidase